MINKCRRRVNERVEYITTEITQSLGGMARKKEAQRKERGSWGARGVGDSHP